MKRKTTRLTFTEEELANPNIRRAAKKAARAADRADKAKAKLSTRAPPKRGLKMDIDKAKERSAQLRFGKAEFGEEIAKPKRRKPGAETLLGGEAHRQVDKQNRDENAGVQAAHEGERLAEGAAKSGHCIGRNKPNNPHPPLSPAGSSGSRSRPAITPEKPEAR